MRYLLSSVLIVLMMVATASAYSINSNGTDVGELDSLLGVYSSFDDLTGSGYSFEPIPDLLFEGMWTAVNGESDIYAHVLEGSDLFTVLYNDQYYLYENDGENGLRYAVIDTAFVSDDEDPEQAPVQEPSTMLLLGTGLVGLAWYGRKRKRA